MRFLVFHRDKTVDVIDEDFGYDALLHITGDFASYIERAAYAQAVADALNAAQIPVREKETKGTS